MLRVGFDARVLAGGEHSSAQEFTANLLISLLKNSQDISWVIFYNANKNKLFPIDLSSFNNVRLVKTSLPNGLFNISMSLFNVPKIDNLLGGVDIFFSPHFLCTSLRTNTKRVLLVNDLSHEHYGHFFSTFSKFWHYLINLKKQIEKSTKIITISNFTKDFVTKTYGVLENKINVVPYGLNSSYKIVSKTDRIYFKIRQKYHLPLKFILFLGKIESINNIRGIINSFEIFAKDNLDYCLVLAGANGRQHQKVFNLAKKSIFSRRIFFCGPIDDNDRVYIYNLADMFLYLSFYDGFGSPLLEAMACGVPVIASNCASLTEVVGEAGILVDPTNYGEIAHALTLINKDNKLKKNLIIRGLERAKFYDWQIMSENILNILYEIGNE